MGTSKRKISRGYLGKPYLLTFLRSPVLPVFYHVLIGFRVVFLFGFKQGMEVLYKISYGHNAESLLLVCNNNSPDLVENHFFRHLLGRCKRPYDNKGLCH